MKSACTCTYRYMIHYPPPPHFRLYWTAFYTIIIWLLLWLINLNLYKNDGIDNYSTKHCCTFCLFSSYVAIMLSIEKAYRCKSWIFLCFPDVIRLTKHCNTLSFVFQKPCARDESTPYLTTSGTRWWGRGWLWLE